jgi:hypothetical protein
MHSMAIRTSRARALTPPGAGVDALVRIGPPCGGSAPDRARAILAGVALYHLAGEPLASRSETGPTLYALTVVGMKCSPRGNATLVGPATRADDLTADWPAAASSAAQAIFGRAPARRAGAVAVIVVVRDRGVSNCVLVRIPAPPLAPGKRGRGLLRA